MSINISENKWMEIRDHKNEILRIIVCAHSTFALVHGHLTSHPVKLHALNVVSEPLQLTLLIHIGCCVIVVSVTPSI